jgi:AAA domain
MSNQWSIPGNDDPENWREMTAMERLARIEHILLLHPRLRSLLERIDQCALSAAEASPSQIHSPLSMAIAGQPGVGKTVLTKIWLAEAMRKTQPPSPYQYLCIPAITTLKALLAAFLCAVTDSHSVPLSSNTTVWMMENRLSRLLPTSDIRLIIVDNCDHLIWHQSRHIACSLIEFLVRIASQSNLSLILLGESGAMEQIVGASPKLERRVGSLLQLPPFIWDRRSPETVIEWRSLLSTLDRALPFDESGLAEEDRAYRLFYATDGVLGWLMKLISFAARKAIFKESTTLRLYDLADAYNLCIAKTSLGRGKVNPFSQSDFGETGA